MRPIDVRKLTKRETVDTDYRLTIDENNNECLTRQPDKSLSETEIKALPVRDALVTDTRLSLDDAGEFVMTNQPDNSAIGTAASKNVGTDPNQVPLNSDLGTAALVYTGTAQDQIELNSQKTFKSFDSLTSAIAFVTANPDTIERLSTASFRNEAECLALSIDYPDGGGADYTIGSGLTANGWRVVDAGAVQLILTPSGSVLSPQCGAISDNLTDSTASLQSLFDSGIESIDIIGNYKSLELVIRENTTITIQADSKLSYTGTGTFITTDTTRCTGKLNLICSGGTIDIGSALVGVNLTSCQSCEFDLYIDGVLPTSIAVDCNGNASSNNGAPYGTTRHFANNILKRVYHIGVCGTLLKCNGVNGAEGGVFTLNTFGLMRARDAKVIGIDISGYADTNDVQGPVNIHITNQGSIGIKFSDEATVYQWMFGLVSFGAYGTATGRTGVHLGNNTRQIEFEKVFVDGENLDNNGLGMIYEPPFIISYAVHGLEYAGSVGTTLTQRTKNRFPVAAAFNSVNKSIVLQNDEAASFSLRNSYGVVSVGSSDSNASCIVSVRVTNDGLEFCKLIASNDPVFTKVLTGPLTGTTGASGTFTVSAGTDGRVYFENRLGYGVRFVPSVIGATSTDR